MHWHYNSISLLKQVLAAKQHYTSHFLMSQLHNNNGRDTQCDGEKGRKDAWIFLCYFFLTKRTRIKKLKVKHANEECLAKRIHYSVTKKNILLAATTGFSQL